MSADYSKAFDYLQGVEADVRRLVTIAPEIKDRNQRSSLAEMVRRNIRMLTLLEGIYELLADPPL